NGTADEMDIDTITVWKDDNFNGIKDAMDIKVADLPWNAGNMAWGMMMMEVPVSDMGDTFFFVAVLKPGATISNTIQAAVEQDSITLEIAGSGPGSYIMNSNEQTIIASGGGAPVIITKVGEAPIVNVEQGDTVEVLSLYIKGDNVYPGDTINEMKIVNNGTADEMDIDTITVWKDDNFNGIKDAMDIKVADLPWNAGNMAWGMMM
ncbi:MAG: hypothetical protein GY849_18635, partial [Deltaproteobacteria bacterium]|nr:hypothetical protein [Deltaproteobacteria bacterium]